MAVPVSPMNVLLWWKRIFIAVFVAVILYLGFWAINDTGLASEVATAPVLGKEFRRAGTTYRTQKVGNVYSTVPFSTPEMYIFKMGIGDQDVSWPVEKKLYDATTVGSQVEIRYAKRRLTGSIKVLSIAREEEK
jgi:hypothetical protein